MQMSDAQVERILKNTKFSMEMEGFTIEKEQENEVRNILTGKTTLKEYLDSISKKAQSYANEV